MKREYNFASKLYLGESIDHKKLDKIKKKLQKRPLLAKVYLLALATNPTDQLEFYDSRWLMFRHYDGYVPYIVGIASDEDEAIALVKTITEDCITKRGDCKLREFLKC